MIVRRTPWVARGPKAPPRKAKSDVMPPMAGPSESVEMRWPSKMPMIAKGTRPTSMQTEHCEPLESTETDPEGGAGEREHDDAEERHHVARQDLRREVGAGL